MVPIDSFSLRIKTVELYFSKHGKTWLARRLAHWNIDGLTGQTVPKKKEKRKRAVVYNSFKMI
jgi:hypothetical protein